MTTSSTARVLAALLACMRFTVVAVLGVVAFAVVTGQPVHADAVPLLRSGIDRVASFASIGAKTPADELRARLQPLLAHHATLAVRFMRATVGGRPDFVETADAVLVGNTSDLQEALQPAIGGESAAQFARRWELRTRMLFRYAAGVRDDNESVRREARQQLEAHNEVITSVLTRATDGRLPRVQIAERLRAQTDDLLAQVEQYAAGDFDRAYRLQRKAYGRMYPVGAVVAAAATDSAVSDITPEAQLRSSLARLLGEHAELAVDTMRAGVTGAEDFDAAAAALDANAEDVHAAFDSLLGRDDAARVGAVWADHIDTLIDYTVAATESDQAAKSRQRDALTAVAERFGTVVADVTDEAAEATEITRAMNAYTQHLVDQIDTYAADDFAQAHDAAYAAVLEGDGLANRLAAAFAEAVGERLPQGGADTGGGGSAWPFD